MRTTYCREHIDKTAEECGLSEITVFEVKDADAFEKEHPQFDLSNCGTGAILALKRVKDKDVQSIAYRHIEIALNRRTPQGGKYNSRLTKKQVEAFIERATLELSTEKKKKVQEKLEAVSEVYNKAVEDIKDESSPVITELQRCKTVVDDFFIRKNALVIKLKSQEDAVTDAQAELSKAESKLKAAKGIRDQTRAAIIKCDDDIADAVEQMNKATSEVK